MGSREACGGKVSVVNVCSAIIDIKDYFHFQCALQLQRPGIEDVAVLKKELVQVQTLMDNMTLEREKESEKLKDECKKLQAEFVNSEAVSYTHLRAHET